MRHRKTGRKFSRTAAHRKAMLENLATSLLVHERIQTTEAKAKELRGVVDRLISLGKRGDIHARRLAAARLKENKQALRYLNESVLDKLFNDIAKRNADRPGGYTRIYKLGRRHGDSAPMAVIELVESRPEEVTTEPVEEQQTTTEASAAE